MTAQFDRDSLIAVELELRRRELAALPLLDFIPAVSPMLSGPRHLAAFANAVERALYEEIRLLVSMPPQHGKTSLVMHAIIWIMLQTAKRHLYITYNSRRAGDVQADALFIAQRAGLEIDTARQDLWVCSNGAQIAWRGFSEGVSGVPVDGIAFVDDAYKDMDAARSEATRSHVDSVWRSAVMPRMHPGSSAIVLSTRWTLDDLIGTLQAERFPDGGKYEVINYPAIIPDEETATKLGRKVGDALWPEARPLAWLVNQRARLSPFFWEAEYMGRPRPAGSAVFERTPVPTYERLPNGLCRAVGLDLAYTEKTSADWAAAVVLSAHGEGANAIYYVENVIRQQSQLTPFAYKLRELRALYGEAATFFTFFGGQERTIIRDILNRPRASGGWGLGIHGRPAAGSDKLSKAQGIAAAWNAGRVLVPARNVDWLGPFLREIGRFTGTEADKDDDQVDALAYAHYALSRGQKVAVLGDAPPGASPLPAGPDPQADIAFQALLRQQGL